MPILAILVTEIEAELPTIVRRPEEFALDTPEIGAVDVLVGVGVPLDGRDLVILVIIIPDIAIRLQGVSQNGVLCPDLIRVHLFGAVRNGNGEAGFDARIEAAGLVAARKGRVNERRIGEVELGRPVGDGPARDLAEGHRLIGEILTARDSRVGVVNAVRFVVQPEEVEIVGVVDRAVQIRRSDRRRNGLEYRCGPLRTSYLPCNADRQ